MTETSTTIQTSAMRHDNQGFELPSKSPVRMGEMAHMVLTTIAAALVTGVLAAPLTMPGQSSAEPSTLLPEWQADRRAFNTTTTEMEP